ncbi:MAG: hypothetical protein JXX14_02080 [Deltaproteobacteria bacterium]|nr:hypothetical protein [Deltaproteobacteria bacterium]
MQSLSGDAMDIASPQTDATVPSNSSFGLSRDETITQLGLFHQRQRIDFL